MVAMQQQRYRDSMIERLGLSCIRIATLFVCMLMIVTGHIQRMDQLRTEPASLMTVLGVIFGLVALALVIRIDQLRQTVAMSPARHELARMLLATVFIAISVVTANDIVRTFDLLS